MNPDQPSRKQIEARLTALLLGELPAAEAELLRWSIAQDPELQKLHDQLKVTIGFVSEAMKNPAGAPANRENPLKLSQERRQTLLAHFKTGRPQQSFWLRRIQVSPLIPALAVVAIIALLAATLLPVLSTASRRSFRASRGQYGADVGSDQSLEETMASIKRTPVTTHSLAGPLPTATPNPQPPTPPLAQIALPNTESSKKESDPDAGVTFSQSVVGYVNVDLSGSKTTPLLPESKTTPVAKLSLPAPVGETAISGSVTPQVETKDAFARGSFGGGGFGPGTTPSNMYADNTFGLSGQGGSPSSGGGTVSFGDKQANTPFESRLQNVVSSDNNLQKELILATNGTPWNAGHFNFPDTSFNSSDTSSANAVAMAGDRNIGAVNLSRRIWRESPGAVTMPPDSLSRSVRVEHAWSIPKQVVQQPQQQISLDNANSNEVQAVLKPTFASTAPANGSLTPPPASAPDAMAAWSANDLHLKVELQQMETPAQSQIASISGRQTEMRTTVIQPNVSGYSFTAAPTAMQPPVGGEKWDCNAVVGPGSAPQQYEMRTSKIDPHTFYAGLQNVSSFPFGSNSITGDSNGGGSGGLLYVTTPNLTRDVSGLAKQYFSSLGINLDPPANLFYNDRLGVLFVYAMPQDEDRIERAMQVLGQSSPQKNLAGNETIPPGLINFEGADANQVLEVYAQLTGRTLLRDSLPQAQIYLKSETPLTKAAAVQKLQQALALHGIAVINVGDKFVKAVPVSKAGTAGAQTDKPLPTPPPNAPIPQPEVQTRDNAFSTFSLNVSDVSFKLASASLGNGQMPDPAAIRSEEFINAFDYHDPEPLQGQPLAFMSERVRDPFAQERDLLRFSVKAAAMGRQEGRALNLVLLLDTSGSMERADRVAIIRQALRVLSAQLQPQDTVSVVTFARTARLWADGVRGDRAGATLDKVGSITPEGGTNLEEAMRLAYETALRHFIAGGMNRVVLLTDGAANLGNADPQALAQKVETERRQGIALDCFGVGWDDYNDDLLEQLSSNGDGRYAFINTPDEASTEFAAKLAGALQVAAEDVKVQVEFNPARVTAWRQIGYAKHQLTKEQFRDNSVAAGAIASREAGNALYVIETKPDGEGPIATVHVRYRLPGTQDNRERSWLVDYTGAAPALEQSSPAMRLAVTAAEFSEWLAHSPFAQDVTPDELLNDLSGVPQSYSTDKRPQQLEWMIRQAKSVSGK